MRHLFITFMLYFVIVGSSLFMAERQMKKLAADAAWFKRAMKTRRTVDGQAISFDHHFEDWTVEYLTMRCWDLPLSRINPKKVVQGSKV
ncbi:unnamed protein product [Effrenium voratum]|uniref:Uncharacterized protein n=1 Tax=Effrenium voratum TaxID=2562239 RepID=A0AA36J9T1_9DINO|nr:unnamed protein product [Effrenium voratum]